MAVAYLARRNRSDEMWRSRPCCRNLPAARIYGRGSTARAGRCRQPLRFRFRRRDVLVAAGTAAVVLAGVSALAASLLGSHRQPSVSSVAGSGGVGASSTPSLVAIGVPARLTTPSGTTLSFPARSAPTGGKSWSLMTAPARRTRGGTSRPGSTSRPVTRDGRPSGTVRLQVLFCAGGQSLGAPHALGVPMPARPAGSRMSSEIRTFGKICYVLAVVILRHVPILRDSARREASRARLDGHPGRADTAGADGTDQDSRTGTRARHRPAPREAIEPPAAPQVARA